MHSKIQTTSTRIPGLSTRKCHVFTPVSRTIASCTFRRHRCRHIWERDLRPHHNTVGVCVCVCMWDLHYVLFGACTLHRIAQKWNDTPDIKPARAHGDLPTWICIFHEPHHLSTVTLLNRTRSCMCVCVCSRVRAQTLRQQNPDVATGGRAAFVALTYTNLCDVHLKAGRIRR